MTRPSPASDASPLDASAAIRRFSAVEVLVVGDLIVDRFLWGRVDRISPEAPVPVVAVHEESLRLGGAANVACNVRALGGRVSLAGVIGADPLGDWLLAECRRLGIGARAVVVDRARRTTEKARVVAQHQQVVRFDREDRGTLSAAAERKLLATVLRGLGSAGAVVLSDYAKGVLGARVTREVIAAARARAVPVLVDPVTTTITRYRGATLVTPNAKEAAGMAGLEIHDEASLGKVGRRLLRGLAAEGILITRGEDGMTLFPRGARSVHIPTEARDVFDVTGAGDTVIATLALCEAVGLDRAAGARVSNAAAGIVVGKVGTAAASAEELLRALGGREAGASRAASAGSGAG